MVGGAAMYPSKTIVDNAVNSKDHTTLVAAVKAAGLVDTLKSAGPFTVFAPTNKAFGKLPAGTVDSLVMPQNKPTLTGILTYHVVAGPPHGARSDGPGEGRRRQGDAEDRPGRNADRDAARQESPHDHRQQGQTSRSSRSPTSCSRTASFT